MGTYNQDNQDILYEKEYVININKYFWNNSCFG